MRPFVARMRARLDLLSMLLIRDLDARYKGSLLGKLWPLVTQASQIALYTYVFGVVLRVRVNVEGLPDTNLAFGIWLFAGLLPWLAFTGGLAQAANSVIGHPNLVKKVVFPMSLLPIVPVLSSLVESSFGLLPLLALFALVTHHVHPTVLLLPLVWIVQIFFTLGFAYIVAGLTVYVRDVPQTLGIILNIWFYLTPIVYPPTAIPPRLRAIVFSINPMVAFIDAYRGLILVGRFDQWEEFARATLFAIFVFTLGFPYIDGCSLLSPTCCEDGERCDRIAISLRKLPTVAAWHFRFYQRFSETAIGNFVSEPRGARVSSLDR